MAGRLDIVKTYKLYVNGAFPRSESGRSLKVMNTESQVIAHISHASRKDLRDAVAGARKAAGGWSRRTAYNRGQILYRMGEMLEGKSDEFAQVLKSTTGENLRVCRKEVATSVDRLIAFAGWADKYAQVLGCNNPVAGPYYNFTVPEPTGVVAVIAPDEPALLGLVSLVAPALCAGNAVVALGSEEHPIATSLFGEVCATSDVPAGALNLLTGKREELASWFAEHRDIDAIHGANLEDELATKLRCGASENVKRVTVRTVDDDAWLEPGECESPWWIEPFVEMKTIWHPTGA